MKYVFNVVISFSFYMYVVLRGIEYIYMDSYHDAFTLPFVLYGLQR